MRQCCISRGVVRWRRAGVAGIALAVLTGVFPATPASELPNAALAPAILPLHASDAVSLLEGGEVTWRPDDRCDGTLAWQSTPMGFALPLQAWQDGAPIPDAAAWLHRDRAGHLTWFVCPRGLATRAAGQVAPERDGLSCPGGVDPRLLADRTPTLSFSPASGEGLVFDPNPVVASGNRDLSSADDVDPWRVDVTLADLDGTGLLRGAWVDVESPAGRAFHPALSFRYSARDLHFEEVMAYHHITQAQRRLQALGFAALNARPQSVTVHATGYDESWYSATERRIFLGDGGVDDAEDADVILHEYGHALRHAAVGALGCVDARSLDEGFSDYLAASFTGDACVGDWDGTFRPGGCLCDLTEIRRYPEDRTGDPHEDGLLWSSTLWRLRELLGADVADQLAVGALYFQLPRSSLRDAAGGLVAAATDLERELGRTDIRGVVEDVLGERGFMARRGTFSLSAGGPACARIALGFPFRGPGTCTSACSDTLTVWADGRCELRPLLAGPDEPESASPVLAPIVTQCGLEDYPCSHELLRVAWTAARGTLTADLCFLTAGQPVRRVIVTLEESGRVALDWSGEGQQVSMPGLTSWFPQGLAGVTQWVELPGWDTETLEPGEGLGVNLPPGPFSLAGARLVFSPDAGGGYSARLDVPPLPTSPALDHAITIYPTPARPGSRAVFRTQAGGTYQLDLLDATGRLQGCRMLGHLDPGLHAIDLEDLTPSRPLAAGVHFVRLRGNADTRIARVLYLH